MKYLISIQLGYSSFVRLHAFLLSCFITFWLVKKPFRIGADFKIPSSVNLHARHFKLRLQNAPDSPRPLCPRLPMPIRDEEHITDTTNQNKFN